jgi:hypothetical protein
MLIGDGDAIAIPIFMEGIMAPERPSYRLDQQYPNSARRGTLWSEYGTYRSLKRARCKASALRRPCRIVEYRVVWRSVA